MELSENKLWGFIESTNEEVKHKFANEWMKSHPMLIVPFYQENDALEALQMESEIRKYFPHPYFVYFSEASRDNQWKHFPLINNVVKE